MANVTNGGRGGRAAERKARARALTDLAQAIDTVAVRWAHLLVDSYVSGDLSREEVETRAKGLGRRVEALGSRLAGLAAHVADGGAVTRAPVLLRPSR